MDLIKKALLTAREKKFLFAAILLLGFSAYIHFVAANSTDKNWLLYAAGKWLGGARLYTDIFEVNPPLILWIFSIPVYISAHIVPLLTAYNVLAILMLAVIALVLHLCRLLLGLHPGFADAPRKQLGFLLILAFILVFCTAPMYFSDREHIFFTLALPYILRFCPAIARKELPLRLKLAIGLLAAIGFCIKPHTAAVFVVLQLLFILRERSLSILWSVENLVIYALGGAYVGFILLCLPEYVHIILPMALETYSAYSRKANGLYSIIACVVITAISFSDFRPRHTSPYRADVYYYIGVWVACLIYGLINNGWAYTYIPLLSMARLLAGLLFIEFLWLKEQAEAAGEPAREFKFGVRSCGGNLALNVVFYLICFLAYMVPTDCGKSMSCKGTTLFFKEARQHPVHSFGSMSLEFYKWPELSRETGAQWVTRFNHLWMLPKFVLSGADFRKQHAWVIDYVSRAYADDLNNNKPDILYVDTSPEIFHNHSNIDLTTYFGVNSPEFRAAWSHYQRTGVIDSCVKAPRGEPEEASLKIDCRFDIYSRIPGQ